jgi:hypothetical protein
MWITKGYRAGFIDVTFPRKANDYDDDNNNNKSSNTIFADGIMFGRIEAFQLKARAMDLILRCVFPKIKKE